MVVLAASVVTRTGKALVSRQFVDMARIRIEGLLAAFPKLVNTGKQHTFVETENVRYVYQPMESLFLVLITNKQSNILEDLETVKLLSRILNEYEMDEETISDHCFEIVFAFDEAISFGHREHINMVQIKTNLSMESHEEKLHKMIIQSKINDTKDIMKKKAMEIDKSKLEKKLESRSSISSSYDSMPGIGAGLGSGVGSRSMGSVPSYEPEPTKFTGKARAAPSEGMKLGKKKASLLDTFKDETAAKELEQEVMTTQAAAMAGPQTPVSVHVEEKVVCTLQNDGTLETLDVQGNMTLEVHSDESSCIRVVTEMGENPGIQFKTHPNIDKALFNKSATLGLKDPKRPFPTGSALGVLKWRFSTKDESLVPLQISCWPSVSGNDTVVNLEYEAGAAFELHNVQIVVPIPGADAPQITSVDGDAHFDARNSCLVWSNELIDDDNREGAMEFTLVNADADGIYPIEARFSSASLFCKVAVQDITHCEDGAPVHGYDVNTALTTDEYVVVG